MIISTIVHENRPVDIQRDTLHISCIPVGDDLFDGCCCIYHRATFCDLGVADHMIRHYFNVLYRVPFDIDQYCIRTGYWIGDHSEGSLILPKYQFVFRIKQGSGVSSVLIYGYVNTIFELPAWLPKFYMYIIRSYMNGFALINHLSCEVGLWCLIVVIIARANCPSGQ